MNIEARARSLLGELGDGAYEHCRASARFALSIENMEVAIVMAATAARIEELRKRSQREA